MAHELSFALNGTAEAFYALKPAWHGLGTVLDHAPTSAEAITAAQLNWRVSLEEIRTASGKIVPDHYATVRSDTGAVLDCVGDKYSVVQNQEAFDFLDSLYQDGLIKYESAGALRGGSRVWLLARMPSVDEIAPGDVSNRYILFATSHDGSASLHAIPTSVRVVCANTLRVAIASDVGFRHSGNVQKKMDYARQYLSQFDEKFTLFRDKARRLAELQFTPEQARDYIEELFPSAGREGRSKSIPGEQGERGAVRSPIQSPADPQHQGGLVGAGEQRHGVTGPQQATHPPRPGRQRGADDLPDRWFGSGLQGRSCRVCLRSSHSLAARAIAARSTDKATSLQLSSSPPGRAASE